MSLARKLALAFLFTTLTFGLGVLSTRLSVQSNAIVIADVDKEAIDRIFGLTITCVENPIMRAVQIKSRIVEIENYTVLRRPNNQQLNDFSSLASGSANSQGGEFVDFDFDVVLRDYTYFAIPIGYTRVSPNEVDCDFNYGD